MHQLTIDRLLELMEKAEPGTSATAILQQWFDEHKKAIAEDQARAEQYAKDNPTRYGVKRVELVQQEMGGTLMPVYKAVEHFAVAVDELEAFAHCIGARLDDLKDVLEGRRAELVLKTGIWRAWTTPQWSASKDYRDRTAEMAEREELLAEDEYVRNWLREWNKNKQSIYQPEEGLPQAIEWRKK